MTGWHDLSARAGRNDLPVILYKAIASGTLYHPSEIARGVSDAWTACEWPLRIADAEVWQWMFMRALDQTEYLLEGRIRPARELPATTTLWRGAEEDYRCGMSWTDDRDRAVWFATRFPHRDARLYRIEATPNMVLARYDLARGEREWVLDPYLIEADDPAPVPREEWSTTIEGAHA